MPLENRVDPFGVLSADPARGAMMGNRGGMFHDPARRALGARRWASRRWLCCSLDYPGAHRHPVWSRGYTQLFFLDEVTALAAGHRPCAECRRADAAAFRQALAGPDAPATLAAIDARLHEERLDGRKQRRHRTEVAALPDGAVFVLDGTPVARRAGALHAWSPSGWRPAKGARLPAAVECLTPPLSLAALRGGYRPLWHRTAPPERPGTGSGTRGDALSR